MARPRVGHHPIRVDHQQQVTDQGLEASLTADLTASRAVGQAVGQAAGQAAGQAVGQAAGLVAEEMAAGAGMQAWDFILIRTMHELLRAHVVTSLLSKGQQ